MRWTRHAKRRLEERFPGIDPAALRERLDLTGVKLFHKGRTEVLLEVEEGVHLIAVLGRDPKRGSPAVITVLTREMYAKDKGHRLTPAALNAATTRRLGFLAEARRQARIKAHEDQIRAWGEEIASGSCPEARIKRLERLIKGRRFEISKEQNKSRRWREHMT